MSDWLLEQIKTVRNLCDIALVLSEQRIDKRMTLLPTILELMLVEIQQIVEENCVVKEG